MITIRRLKRLREIDWLALPIRSVQSADSWDLLPARTQWWEQHLTFFMTTPADLHMRRLALGFDRSVMAQVSGISSGEIAKFENPKIEKVYLDYEAAIRRVEEWDSEPARAAIRDTAERFRIDDRPVIWLFPDQYGEFCPWLNTCLSSVALARFTAAEVYADLLDEGAKPIAAEFFAPGYHTFIGEKGMDDTPGNRCKWWRWWTQRYKTAT